MRSKEEANDYRYFPDPDLLPLIITDELIEQIRKRITRITATKTSTFYGSNMV